MPQSGPMNILEAVVLPEWIDYNGHMNVGYYNVAFDKATDGLFDRLDMGLDYVKRENKSFFTLQTNVHYIGEVLEGTKLRYTVQLLDFDPKRVHAYFEMFNADEGYLSATSEQMMVHVDLETRKSAAMPDDLLARVRALYDSHRDLPRPEKAGQGMAIRRRTAEAG
ncbi:MAG: thioesterase family protein [Minwuia sp.]|uniref:thioesterase family protein n=1 Tax=Minwuia sp. TaxID=2493630 RepID=UPI003A84B7A3